MDDHNVQLEPIKIIAEAFGDLLQGEVFDL